MFQMRPFETVMKQSEIKVYSLKLHDSVSCTKNTL